ncbi:MAG: alpha-L-rhamnosidase [Paenibacillaceae bacterium]|jgi:hypothetical protein|nr:alpha-L-rhamnosidase [Paenibacillaceae bacterium]
MLNKQTERRIWDGAWIGMEKPQGQGNGNELVWFRRTFFVPNEGCTLRLHVSADSRYRLYINGRSVGVGPCKGDANRQYFETYDVSSHLRPGTNIIAAKVLHYGMGGPMTLSGPCSIWRSPWGAFILDGVLASPEGMTVELLHTDERWRCCRDDSYALVHDSWMSSGWLGGIEHMNGMAALSGAERVTYEDAGWKQAVCSHKPMNKYGILTAFPLTARTIPMMSETPAAFNGAVRSSLEGPASFPLRIAPGDTGWIELDAGELTTGYISLVMSGGSGATVRIRYAECYESTAADGKRQKGLRDDWTTKGQMLRGDADIYLVSGHGTDEDTEEYEPFWFRTFRYVRLEWTAAREPLVLIRADYRETGYPLEVHGDFRCSDPEWQPLWDISVRTLRRCMHETYEDCPYYEQLQYTMDTALQAMFTYRLSGDDRLARKAIHDYHCSQLPDGMLQSRFPSVEPQVIPGFSLYWVGMLHEHYRFFGDAEYIRMYLPTADGVLEWFRRRIGEQGLVEPADPHYWSFIDWVAEWPNGVPPANAKGPMAMHSLLLAATLQQAAELNQAVGRISTAEEYRALSGQLNEAVKRTCWSEQQQLFCDGPAVHEYSQHTQLWSVLSGLMTGEAAKHLMRRTLSDNRLAQASYPMIHFLFRALSVAGLYEESYGLWQPWHDMVKLHLTTWAESPTGNRSDCHAWGALPLYEFPAEVLGIKPGAPGFASIRIEPKEGPLRWAEGTSATPHGPVRVRWEHTKGFFRIEVKGPANVPVTLKLPDGSLRSYTCCCSIEEAVRLL